MYSHMIPGGKIGYEILKSDVSILIIEVHLTANAQWCIFFFCVCTRMTTRSNKDYVNLTSEVFTGHWRSKHRGHWRYKIAIFGHILMTTLRDAFFIFACVHIRLLETLNGILVCPQRS